MKDPSLKKIYQVYRMEGEKDIYIGKGPDKFVINDPSHECEKFILQLDGKKSLKELRQEFKETDKWLDLLDSMNLLEQDFGVNETEYERWSRQIYHFQLYDRKGFDPYKAQEKLRNAKVVVLGVGAGGTTLLRYLSTTGIGNLEAVDYDKIELSNLTTHTSIDENDVGLYKVDSIKKHLQQQNTNLNFKVHNRKLISEEDIIELITGADFAIQAFDYPRSIAPKWTNNAGIKTGTPFGSIGVTDKGARVGPFVLPRKTACWECVGLPKIQVLRDHKAPLMGTIVAMLASIATHEIVKYISGFAESFLFNQSLYINTETMDFQKNSFSIKPECNCQKSPIR